jgi:hypothetical protein
MSALAFTLVDEEFLQRTLVRNNGDQFRAGTTKCVQDFVETLVPWEHHQTARSALQCPKRQSPDWFNLSPDDSIADDFDGLGKLPVD